MNFALTWKSFPALLAATGLTLQLVILSVLIGFGIALGMALMRLSRFRSLSLFAGGYIFVFRGTPLLVQIFLIYYGLGQFAFIRESFLWPFLRQPYWCAILALALNTGGYTAEILRGGIQSVPRGVVEAARALGLRRVQTFRLVVFPLAIRQALPAYGNELILMVKATSLASVITMLELTGVARAIIARTYDPIPVFIAAGAIYLAINFTVAQGVRLAERWLTPERRA